MTATTAISIRHANGHHTVYAYIHGEWAAHESVEGDIWDVTHVPSGMNLRAGYRGQDLDEPQARAVAICLAVLVPELRLDGEAMSAHDADTIRGVLSEVLR